MPERQLQRIKLHNQERILWPAVFFLAVMVIATAALVGIYLFPFTRKSDCEISLYQGQTYSEKQQLSKNKATTGSSTGTSSGSMTGSGAGTTVGNTTTGSTSAGNTSTGSTAGNANAGFQVSDDQQIWSTDTSIDLFHIRYTNGYGEISVQGENGDKIVAPGTDGQYTFSLKNTGSKEADYKVWIEAGISSGDIDFPVLTKMKNTDGWLLGSDDVWENAEDLNGVSAQGQMEAGKSQDYTIYWQWPFEQEEDERDTALGNLNDGQELTYTVTIHTQASMDTDSGAADRSQGTAINSVKTGDYTPVTRWILILTAAAAVFGMGLYFIYKRKKEQDRS